MKIVRPYAALLKPSRDTGSEAFGIASLQSIEWAGRISHRSEEAQSDESWRRFLEAVVIGHGDWSIVEHVSVSVDMLVDRGITHELVRHRLFSFTQESTRFVNYQKKMPPSFIYPKPDVECELCLSGEEPYWSASTDTEWAHGDWHKVEENPVACAYEPTWLASIAKAEQSYKLLTKPVIDGGRGWRPQEARSVFPNALASRIVVTGNLRNWRHFFIMRTTAEAHPQMRQVTIPLLTEFQRVFPVLYDDIVPLQAQSAAMKKAR